MASDSMDLNGMFKNMKNIGFSMLQALFEKIDNAISAGATDIRITNDKRNNLIIFADNGRGMNLEGLRGCKLLHGRTDSTSDKHGRFGVGGNIADIYMTDLGHVTYVSRSEPVQGYDAINQMTIYYDSKTISEYSSNPPHGATRTTEEEIWNKCSINKDKSGTVQLLTSTPIIMNEIIFGIESNDITVSYRYTTGVCYCNQLKKGLNIELCIDNNVYKIFPIDLLQYSDIIPEHNDTYDIYVYEDENDKYVFCFDKGKDIYYYDFVISKQGRETKIHKNEIAKLKLIGIIKVDTMHHPDWKHVLKHDIDANNLDYADKLYIEMSNMNFHEITGGRTIERNGKQLARLQYKYNGLSLSLVVPFQTTRQKISFNANDRIDALFSVMVNKSNLDEINIDVDLRKTIEKIFKKFASKLIVKPNITSQSLQTIPDDDEIMQDELQSILPSINTIESLPLFPSQAMFNPTDNIVPIQTKKISKNKTTPPMINSKQEHLPTVNRESLMCTLEVKLPEVKLPEVKLPEVKLPEVKLPEVKLPIDLVLPITPIVPIPITVHTCISFSKSNREIIAHYKKDILFRTRYIGQYSISESHYINIRNKLGDERFVEYITKSNEKGLFELNDTYFS